MTQLDRERIATLAGHPGWQGLLKLLDEADDVLLAQLENAPADKENEILYLWRASRRFKKLVQDYPENLADELGALYPRM